MSLVLDHDAVSKLCLYAEPCMQALHRGADIDKSAIKQSSRKQRGREASPQIPNAAPPSEASVLAASAVQSALADDQDASHSQGKQATAGKLAPEAQAQPATAANTAPQVKAGPAATAADGGHSQLDHLAASKTADRPAAAPASTASKLRSGRTSAKTVHAGASPIAASAGSKRSQSMAEQPHPPARESIASKPKKQRTSVTAVSTATKPATDSTQSGIAPNGASKQATQSKTGLRVKLVQRKASVDLTAPPASASTASAPDAQPSAVKHKQSGVHQPTHRAQATFQQTKTPHTSTHATAHAVSSPPATDASNAGHAQPEMLSNAAAASGDVATTSGRAAATEDGADAPAVSKIRLNTQQRARRGIARRALPSLAEAYQKLHDTQGGQPATSADGHRTSSGDNAAASDSDANSDKDAAASKGGTAMPGGPAAVSGVRAGAAVGSQPELIEHRSVLSRQRKLGLPTMAEAYQRLDAQQNLSSATSDASDGDAAASGDDAAASGGDVAALGDRAGASGDDAAASRDHAAASAQGEIALGSLESDSADLPEVPKGYGSRPIPPKFRRRIGITRTRAEWLQLAQAAAVAASDTSSKQPAYATSKGA